MLKRIAARTILFLLVGSVIAVNKMRPIFSKLLNFRKIHTASNRPFRIVMIGTFENPGWFYAHVEPLVKCNLVQEVIVITDEKIDLDIKNVRFETPPPLLAKTIGRMFSRLITVLIAGWKYRPKVYMGYHIMPNSLWALLAASIFGGKAFYQMTGGPAQVEGGGFKAENPLLSATKKPSRLQQELLYSLVRCFDLVIVRGESAKDFVNRNKLNRNCIVITGAMNTKKFSPDTQESTYDLVYVARLAPVKGLPLFLDVIAKLKEWKPNILVSIVGDGPLLEQLTQQQEKLNLKDNLHFLGKIKDVVPTLRKSKVFVLLSENEGMSIAMLEAMSCGLPVVIRNVGDLRDAIQNGQEGILLDEEDTNEIATKILALLNDSNLRLKQSIAARKMIIQQFSTEAITNRWNEVFNNL